MKTLNEQVKEVMNGKGSRYTKSIELVKLGLTPHEISIMLGSVKVSKKCKFNVNALTFGVELEVYNVVRTELIREVEQRSISIQSEGYNHTDNNHYYKIVSDASICGENGNEVVSPILKGKKGLDSLKEVCESLENVGAKVNRSSRSLRCFDHDRWPFRSVVQELSEIRISHRHFHAKLKKGEQ